MSIVKPVLVGVLSSMIFMAVTACDSPSNSAVARDAKGQAAAPKKGNCDSLVAKNNDPLCSRSTSVDDFKKLSLEAKFVLINRKLLEQSDQIFSEVWKQLVGGSAALTPPVSIFRAAAKHLDAHFAINGSEVVIDERNRNCSKVEEVAVITRDEKGFPKSLEIFIQRCDKEKVARVAEFMFTSHGNMTFAFEAGQLPEGAGERLAQLRQVITCNLSFLATGQVSKLTCTNLGQDASPGVSMEFEGFSFDKDCQEKMLSAKAVKYLGVSNQRDPKFRSRLLEAPKKGQITITEFCAPLSEFTTPPGKDPVCDAPAPVPAKPPPAPVPPPAPSAAPPVAAPAPAEDANSQPGTAAELGLNGGQSQIPQVQNPQPVLPGAEGAELPVDGAQKIQ